MSASPELNFTAVISSDLLLGPFFSGASWNTWRAVMKALDCEPLTDEELATFHEIAGGRNPPVKRVRELVAAVGRGGGKDSIASGIAACIAINCDPRGRLRPGEKAVVMCLACDRHQAGIIFSYIRGYFEQVPALARMVVSIGADSIELTNGVIVEVHTNSMRSVRGRSLLLVCMDEAAFFRDENFSSPDVEIDAAVGPGLARIPGSLKIIISSVHKRGGLLFQKVTDHYGKDDPDVLVVMGPTLTFNPSFDAAIIEKALAQDPERYGAEYLCRWRDDLSSFIGRDLLDAAIDKGVIVRPPVVGVTYFVGCDVSGGRTDSFTAAVAHREQDGRIVLDTAFERKPPFDPNAVVTEVVRLMQEYRCNDIFGDNYAAEWVVSAFQREGAKYIRSERDRSAVYMDTLPIFTSGRARLLDNSRIVSQFAALERRTFSTGRERIDPGPGHDDLACSVALAMSLADKFKPNFQPKIVAPIFVGIATHETLAPHLAHGPEYRRNNEYGRNN